MTTHAIVYGLLNIIGLVINFFGAFIMYRTSPQRPFSIALTSDGGKHLNENYNKKMKKGWIFFFIGFGIQVVAAILGLLPQFTLTCH